MNTPVDDFDIFCNRILWSPGHQNGACGMYDVTRLITDLDGYTSMSHPSRKILSRTENMQLLITIGRFLGEFGQDASPERFTNAIRRELQRVNLL